MRLGPSEGGAPRIVRWRPGLGTALRASGDRIVAVCAAAARVMLEGRPPSGSGDRGGLGCLSRDKHDW